MSDTVKVRYSSGKNITFEGELDTHISREEWDEMTDKEKDEVYDDMVWDLVQFYEIED